MYAVLPTSSKYHIQMREKKITLTALCSLLTTRPATIEDIELNIRENSAKVLIVNNVPAVILYKEKPVRVMRQPQNGPNNIPFNAPKDTVELIRTSSIQLHP
jgi:hypothetical protein